MTTLHIKNMVCDRCKKVIHDELTSIGVEIVSLDLRILVIKDEPKDISGIKEVISANGFELIEENDPLTIEHIKLFLLGLVQHLPPYSARKIYL